MGNDIDRYVAKISISDSVLSGNGKWQKTVEQVWSDV